MHAVYMKYCGQEIRNISVTSTYHLRIIENSTQKGRKLWLLVLKRSAEASCLGVRPGRVRQLWQK